MSNQDTPETLTYWQEMLAANTRLFSEHASRMVKAAKLAEYFARKIEAALDKRIAPQTGEAIGCAAMLGGLALALFVGQVFA